MDNLPANQNQPLGQDPNFLRYLQGFLAKPINAGLIQKKRVSSIPPADGQTLVWNQKSNQYQPAAAPTTGSSTTITYVSSVNFAGSTYATKTLTFTNGLLTSYT